MNRKIVLTSLLFLAILMIVAIVFQAKDKTPKLVTNFSECSQAGYPILESYPRRCVDKTGKSYTENISDKQLETKPIINEPKKLEISSPIEIKGKARGNWFFEGQFPIEITDENGKILGQGSARSSGNWLTEDYITFSTKIVFSTSTTAKGFIILKKDNPSGLSENDVQEKIIVSFSTQKDNEKTEKASSSPLQL